MKEQELPEAKPEKQETEIKAEQKQKGEYFVLDDE